MARITILGHAVGIRYIFCDITADYNRKMRLLVLAAVLFLATPTATSTSTCEPGSFRGAHRTCTPCPPGFFSNTTNTTICLPCPNGFYSNASGAASCTPCPAGEESRAVVAAAYLSETTHVTDADYHTPDQFFFHSWQDDLTPRYTWPLKSNNITWRFYRWGSPRPSLALKDTENSVLKDLTVHFYKHIYDTDPEHTMSVHNTDITAINDRLRDGDDAKILVVPGPEYTASATTFAVIEWTNHKQHPRVRCVPCKEGDTKLKDELFCSPCLKGEYWLNASTECGICPANSETTNYGQQQCTQCRDNFQKFADVASECTACPPNTFSDGGEACKSCQPGFVPGDGRCEPRLPQRDICRNLDQNHYPGQLDDEHKRLRFSRLPSGDSVVVWGEDDIRNDSTTTHVNITELDTVPKIHRPSVNEIQSHDNLTNCSCPSSHVVTYVPLVVLENNVIYRNPPDPAFCTTLNTTECEASCTTCFYHCRYACMDNNYFQATQLFVPYLVQQQKAVFFRTCVPQAQHCSANTTQPVIPDGMSPPFPRWTASQTDHASVVRRVFAARWQHGESLRVHDGHLHTSLLCPGECEGATLHVLPGAVEYESGRFYSVLVATNTKLSSTTQMAALPDVHTREGCEHACWSLGLQVCQWYSFGGNECYLDNSNTLEGMQFPAFASVCDGQYCSDRFAPYSVSLFSTHGFQTYRMLHHVAHIFRTSANTTSTTSTAGLQFSVATSTSISHHDCAALCASQLNCSQFATWTLEGTTQCALPGTAAIPDGATNMQLFTLPLFAPLRDAHPFICLETPFADRQVYDTEGVVSCAKNAARSNQTRTCQVCPANEQGASDVCDSTYYSPACEMCIPCPDGFTRNSTASECTLCASDQYFDCRERICQPCPPHFKQSRDSFFRCSRCLDGSCGRCDPGFGLDPRGVQNCTWCPSDALDPDTNICACPPGWMASGQADGVGCVACAPGTAKAGYGNSGECVPCPAGSVAPEQGAARCVPCERDRGPGFTTATQCLPARGDFGTDSVGGAGCPAGYEQVEIDHGFFACLPCGQGWFKNTSGTEACLPCSVLQPTYNATACAENTCVFYAQVQHAVEGLSALPELQAELSASTAEGGVCNQNHQFENGACQPCAPGSVSGTYEDRCEACPAGTFEEGNVCQRCAQGFWSAPGSTACEKCPGNLTSVFPEGCVCPAGEEPMGGACVPCQDGQFKARAGNVSCVSCQTGNEVTNGRGATACQKCQEYASVKSDGVQCTCDEGFFDAGGGRCETCGAGRYVDVEGQCRNCSAHQVSLGIRAQACEDCRVPGMVPSRRQDQCVWCLPGKVSSATTDAECRSCEGGKFAAGVGQTACEECAPGKFASIAGSTTCEKCPPGKVSAQIEQGTCETCLAGTYADGYGNVLCTKCEPGKYQNASAQTGCLECAAGKYALVLGVVECLAMCVPGEYWNGSACVKCQAGSYNDGYSNTFGTSTSCQLCDVGKYSSDVGSVECSICDLAWGYYQNSEGQTTCDRCPGFAVALWMQNIEKYDCFCDGGLYFLPDRNECVGCVSGKFKSNASIIITDQDDSQLCTSCLPGTYNPDFKRSVCWDCGFGYYNAYEGQESCYMCPTGMSTEGTQSTSADACRCDPGFYLDDTDENAFNWKCIACPEGKYSNEYGTRALGSEVCKDCNSNQVSLADRTGCHTCQCDESGDRTDGSCKKYHTGDCFKYDESSDNFVQCESPRYNRVESGKWTCCAPPSQPILTIQWQLICEF